MVASIVRQAIVGLDKKLLGYEIMYEKKPGMGLYNQEDTEAANAIADVLLQLDSKDFLGDKPAFISFTPNLLQRDIPQIFQPESLVIQVDDSVIIHPQAQAIIHELRKQGYRVAVNNFEFSARYFGLMDIVDFIKLDMKKSDASMRSIVQVGESFQKQIIAYNVDSRGAYDAAKALGCKFLQGTAVAEAMSAQVHRMEHLQTNFFQLMVAVTREEPDVDEIAEIVSRDVTLTFSLLKLVNSAYFALRNRVNSVKSALVVLGLGQLKQWIYLLSFKQNEMQQLTGELIKTSFLRASFCSELSEYAKLLSISKSDAYLIGMFSTLGTLMEVPLDKALSELPVSEEIKDALISRRGPCGVLYSLVLNYENADWQQVESCAAEIGVPENIVAQKYFECVEQVNGIWKDLMMPAAQM